MDRRDTRTERAGFESEPNKSFHEFLLILRIHYTYNKAVLQGLADVCVNLCSCREEEADSPDGPELTAAAQQSSTTIIIYCSLTNITCQTDPKDVQNSLIFFDVLCSGAPGLCGGDADIASVPFVIYLIKPVHFVTETPPTTSGEHASPKVLPVDHILPFSV